MGTTVVTKFQIHLPLHLVHLRFLRWVPSTKTKGSNDNCVQYNINANNLSNLIIPLKPRRMMKPSEIDYESKRKYSVHLQPASIIRYSSLKILLQISNDAIKPMLLIWSIQIRLLSYKAHCNLPAEFLKCLQDQVRYRGCPKGLEADNTPMYQCWKNSVYHRWMKQ